MTKIAFLIGSANNEGGIARVTSIISKQLNKTNDIHIIGYSKNEEIGYNWDQNLTYSHLLPKRKPLKKTILSASIKLKSYLKKNEIDVLVSCGAVFGPLGVLGSIFTKTKHIYWDHSNFFQTGDHSFEGVGKKFTAKYSDLVIALTKEDSENYTKHSKAKKVEQIYNPIDEGLSKYKKEYNIKSKVIISVGRLCYQKNFVSLIDVAKDVLEKNPDWSWHIFGKGECDERIKEKIKNCNLTEKVILKGHSNNLYDEYNKYSFLVMSSRYEGFPMSLLEGMALGLPLVSYDIKTGPKEIILKNENGFLIDFENKNEMALQINNLIKDNNKRLAFSNKQNEFIEQFELNSIINKWNFVIKKVIND